MDDWFKITPLALASELRIDWAKMSGAMLLIAKKSEPLFLTQRLEPIVDLSIGDAGVVVEHVDTRVRLADPGAEFLDLGLDGQIDAMRRADRALLAR